MTVSFQQNLCIWLVLLIMLSACNDNSTNELSCSEESFQAPQMANQTQEQIERFIISKNGKLGFIDRTGKIVIEPLFSNVKNFSGNRAAFNTKDKWGFIDLEGNIVIEPQFDLVSDFIEGRSTFKKADKWGLIDLNGKVVIEPTEHLGLAEEQRLVFEKDNKWGLMDLDGKIISEARFTQIGSFSEGLSPFTIKQDNKIKKQGFIDRNGQIVIELPNDVDLSQDSDIQGITFKDRRVPVYKVKHFGFPKKLFIERAEYVWGYIDSRGRQVIPFKYNSVSNFSECLAAVEIEYKKYFINVWGNVVIEVKNSNYNGSFSEGLASIQIGEKWGYIDKNGKIAIKPQFEKAFSFINQLANVKINGKWGAIDKTGKIVIEAKFDDSFNFHQSLAEVKIGKKWGYINRAGQFVWSTIK